MDHEHRKARRATLKIMLKKTQDPLSGPDGQSDYAIDARALYKVYKGTNREPDKEALSYIDLQVPRGSIFGLLGPNGAGKSTFINILAGLVIKTSGTVRIWGFDIDRNPRQARASIGVVPQELLIDVFFAPFEALEIQAGLYGVPKSKRRTMEILRALGLESNAKAYSRTLSGGMKRRLLVAKALVHNPPVLILDEPTAGVDIELRRQLWDYIGELHTKGVTIVLTTHYLEEAEALCDMIAIINHGKVVACESTPKLLARIEEKTVIIRPDDPLAQVPESLDGLNVELREDGAIAIHYNPLHTTMGKLLDRIKNAGIQINDLTTEEAGLEDIFMQLTYDADR